MDKVKKYLKEWLEKSAGRKGDIFLIDINKDNVEVLDDKKYNQCPLCLNHTYLIDEHHKDRNRNNNTKDNAIDICVFCHLHGIHQQSFKIRTIPDEQFENDFGNLLELVKEYDEYETYKFIDEVSDLKWSNFMEAKNLEPRYEKLRETIRVLIGIWLYENPKPSYPKSSHEIARKNVEKKSKREANSI